MKKKFATLLFLFASLALIISGCGAGSTSNAQTNTDKRNDNSKMKIVRWNSGTSGNVLMTIAEEKGYFADENLKIKYVPADANTDALTMLATNKVDVVSNAGTSNPLQQIASGVDLTIFGGHMVTGSMPIVAKKGTKWHGPQDLVGKKFACNPSYFAFTGALMDLGYNDPLKSVDWVSYTDYNDALAAVVNGEVDYALMGTGQNYAVQNMDDVDIMCYQSDIMPNYSCCRMESQTKFVKENPETIEAIMVALIRAQDYYESNKKEAVKLHAKKINAQEDYVAAYMLNKHYDVNVDPLKNSVVRAWNILEKTDFLDKNAKDIDITDHVNTKLYEKALKTATERYGKENADFYKKMQSYYEENNL